MISLKKTKKLVIFGTGEIADLAHFYFSCDSEYEVVGFTADDSFVSHDQTFVDKPVIRFSEVTARFPPQDHSMHVALSYRQINRIRENRYLLSKQLGYSMASYLCSKSVYWHDLKIGDNCFVLENQTIQPTVSIGNNVMLWSGNHIGHATEIEDSVYVSSHVVISGHCKIGQRAFLGVNSTVRDFVKIGREVFVTMGASVTADVDDGGVVLGARGTVLTCDSRQAIAIRKKYFSV